MKKYIILLILLGVSVGTYAQLGGMRVYGGLSTLTNKDAVINPDGQLYSGYHIGADGRIMSGTMSFLLGARYTGVSRQPSEDIVLFGHDSMISLLNGRVGLDYSIFSIRDIFRIRTKALASFDIVINTTGSEIAVPGYKLNDGWLSGVVGLGFDIGPAIVDVEYAFGVLNAYNKKKDSIFTSWTASVGFFF